MTDAAVDHTDVAGADDAILVLPDAWVLDDVTRERMARQLARAPEQVAGIVAETGELPSGTSYRVHAERLAMEPLSAVTEIPENTASGATGVRGAVLLRAGVGYALDDGLVRIERGSLLIDHGCHAHDPWRPVGEPQTATPLGRPPFSWRPVVVILGTKRDPDAEDWARRLANDLLRRDVEGRVALPEAASGLHLTRPCRPDAASIAALAPDVIIGLDDRALERAATWSAPNRSTILVGTTPEISDAIDLVSWRVGNASGRLRARLGRGVGAPAVAALVNRLCAGPHPAPPRDEDVVGAEPGPAPPSPPVSTVPRAHSVIVLAGELDGAAHARIEGLADHAGATGGTVRLLAVEEITSSVVSEADLLMLRAVSLSSALSALIDARHRQGRTTVVDIGLADVRFPPGDGAAVLTPPVEQLAAAAGLASTASPAIRAALHARGVRAHLMPTLITRARAAELRRLRGQRGTLAAPVVGWHVGADVEARELLAGQLVNALAEHPALQVELAGDAALVPEVLRRHRRVRVTVGEPDPATRAQWSVQLWTPHTATVDVSGDLRPVVEAAYLGVPTLVSGTNPAALHGLVPGALVVEAGDREPGDLEPGDSSAWMTRLDPLLGDDRKIAGLAQRLLRRIDALYNTPTSAAVVARFTGWAYNRVGRP